MSRILMIVSLFLSMFFVAGTAFGQEVTGNEQVSGNEQASGKEKLPVLSLAPMEIQEPDFVGERILTDIGFDVLYTGATIGLMAAILLSVDEHSDDDEYTGEGIGAAILAITIGSIGAVMAPAVAVHSSHLIWGGDGSLGWTYAGALFGALSGVVLGAVAYNLDKDVGLGFMCALMPLGGLVGAILGYEVSNKSNREEKQNSYFAVSKIYPVIELGQERKTFGVGIEF